MQKNDVGADDSVRPVEMPDVTGMSLTEAKKILKELGLEVEIEGEEKEEIVVTDQLPKKGIEVSTGTKVTIYVQ
ncbi:MAG: PASTA domain-containing protein [Clostridia bacterium]|nr:PASTA domain-containing protein [Clostridia bacterium]